MGKKVSEKSLKNLIPLNKRPPEEAKRIREKGVKAKQMNAEKRKAFKDIADILLKANYKRGVPINIENINSIAELKNANMSSAEKIVLEQILKAVSGDTSASKFIAELSGELKNKIEVNNEKPFEVNIKVVE